MSRKTRETIFAVLKLLLLGFVYLLGAGGLWLSVLGLPPGAQRAGEAAVVVLGAVWGFVIGWWSDRLTRWGSRAGLIVGAALVVLVPFAMPPLNSPFRMHLLALRAVDPNAMLVDAIGLSAWLLAIVLLLIPPILGGMGSAWRRLRRADASATEA